MQGITIIDLARELGLSKTTVSDALAGSGRVSSRTRQRVVDAARDLGYVHNRAARSLRAGTTGALGLYIPSVIRGLAFYAEFSLGMAEAAGEAGYDLTLFTGASPHAGVDGAVVADAEAGDAILERLAEASVPVVTTGRPAAAVSSLVGYVEIDHAALVAEVLDRLDAAARTPGYIGPFADDGPTWAIDSHRGYDRWCAAHDRESSAVCIPVEVHEATLVEALRSLVDRGVDLFVFGPQGLASRSMPILHALGVDIAPSGAPTVVSLAGDPSTELGSSNLVAVDLRPREFGRAAVELLLDGGVVAERPVRRTHKPAIA